MAGWSVVNGDSRAVRKGSPRIPTLTVECSVSSSANASLMTFDCAPTAEQYRKFVNDVEEDRQRA